MPSSSGGPSVRFRCVPCVSCGRWPVGDAFGSKFKRSKRRRQERANVTLRSSGPLVRPPLEILNCSSRSCYHLVEQTCPVVEIPGQVEESAYSGPHPVHKSRFQHGISHSPSRPLGAGSHARGKVYVARESIACPGGKLKSLEHNYPYTPLPGNGIAVCAKTFGEVSAQTLSFRLRIQMQPLQTFATEPF